MDEQKLNNVNNNHSLEESKKLDHKTKSKNEYNIQVNGKTLNDNRKSKSQKNGSFKNLIVLFILAGIIYLFYYMTEHRPDSTVTSMSEVEKLITKDIDSNYPSSPREVLKLYGRITKCFYNEKLDEEQLKKLSEQMRLLMDEELLLNNPIDMNLIDLNAEIYEFKEAERSVISYTVEKASSVVYSEKENHKYASLIASFSLKEDGNVIKVNEEFILRQDEKGNWKILGWKVSDKKDIDTED